MRRLTVPICITVLVILVSIAAGIYITSNMKTLTDHEKIQNLIALVLGATGVVSATYIVYSYVQTNWAFVLSQKPTLLVQVESSFATDQQSPQIQHPLTRIHYRDTSPNSFNNLTFDMQVRKDRKSVNISDLFKKKMRLPAHDTRQRTFRTVEELSRKGLEIEKEAASGNSVFLVIQYSYTFDRRIENVIAQEYRWNQDLRQWQIP